jgi:hypothetical protein
LLLGCAPVLADEQRLTLFDLKLGTTIDALPAASNFKEFACGTNGGPPGAPLSGWAQYGQCAPEADGLHEIYFEYDDEAEYIARAHDDFAAGWEAGTAIDSFPIIASALFDDRGHLMGLRIVTDPRPNQRNDPFLHFRPRQEHYLLGLYLESRFGITDGDCTTIAPVPGEGAVLGMFVKEDCARVADDVRYSITSRLLRRPGETDIDPATGFPTEGAFFSETRAEMRLIGPVGPG